MSALPPFTLCGIIFNVVKHHWHLSRTQSISRLIECIYTLFPRYVDLEAWIRNRNHLVGRPTISRYALICPVWIEGLLLLKGSYVTARLQLTNVCDISTVTFLHWDSVCSANSLPLNWLLRSSVAECFVDESLSSANAASAGARSRMSAHPQVKSWNEEKHEVQKKYWTEQQRRVSSNQ